MYAPVSNDVADARDAVGFNITLQALIERESAMVHRTPVQQAGYNQARTTHHVAKRRIEGAVFQAAAALLPKCQSQLAQVLLAWLQGARGQEP